MTSGGRIAIYGRPHKGDAAYGFQIAGNVQLCAWPAEEHRTYFWVWNLLRRGLVPVEKLRTHTWPLADAAEAFAQVAAGDVVKGFLVM